MQELDGDHHINHPGILTSQPDLPNPVRDDLIRGDGLHCNVHNHEAVENEAVKTYSEHSRDQSNY